MPHTRSRSSSRAPVGGMGWRVGSVRAATKATSTQHKLSLLNPNAKFQAPACNSKDGSGECYLREVRLHMGNPSVPAIPSRAPPKNPARKSAAPFGLCGRHGELPVHVARVRSVGRDAGLRRAPSHQKIHHRIRSLAAVVAQVIAAACEPFPTLRLHLCRPS